MRVAMLIEELRTLGAAVLLIFPARRKLRRVQADYAQLRRATILTSVESPVAAENRQLRASITEAADVLVAALEDPATPDARDGLRLVR